MVSTDGNETLNDVLNDPRMNKLLNKKFYFWIKLKNVIDMFLLFVYVEFIDGKQFRWDL